MKAYLVSILLVGLALGGMGLGTNTITTGDLEIQGYLYDASGNYISADKFVLNGLVPSDKYTHVGYLVVRNPSTVEEKFRLWLSTVDDPKGLKDQVDLKVTLSPGWVPPLGSSWAEYMPSAELEVFDDKLSSISGQAHAFATDNYGVEPLAQNEFAVFKLEARLNADAGNYYEAAMYVADLYLQAGQYEAPEGAW